MKKLLSAFVVMEILIFMSPFYGDNLKVDSTAHAGVQTITASDTAMFDFGEDDEKIVNTVKNIARMRAIQVAKEKAGIYLKSFSKTVNGVLTDDDISVYSNSNIEIVDVTYKKLPYEAHDVKGNATGKIGVMYEATVTTHIDPSGLSKYIELNPQERAILSAQNKISQDAITETNQDFEKLRQSAKNNNSSEIKASIEKLDNKVLAIQKYEVGNFIFTENPEKAILKYTEAIHLNPNFSEAYTVRGATYYKLGKYSQAIDDCNTSIKIASKDNYANHLILGASYSDLKNYKQAILEFNKSIKFKPNLTVAYTKRGIAYYWLKNYKQALSDLNKAIEIDPNYATAYAHRGVVYNDMENYEQAIMDCSRAIQIDSKFAAAYFYRGTVYMELGKYDEVIADFTKAIELEPEHSGYYQVRGVVYEKLGKIDKAKADFTKAESLDYNG